jgi:hypothetical protein
MSVNVSFKGHEDATTGRRVRNIIADRGYALVHDYLANDGTTRLIRIALPGDTSVVSDFSHLLLHDVLGLRRLAPMHYGFDEWDAS